jgi:hypothetical protein
LNIYREFSEKKIKWLDFFLDKASFYVIIFLLSFYIYNLFSI